MPNCLALLVTAMDASPVRSEINCAVRASVQPKNRVMSEVDKYDYSKHPEAKKLHPSKAVSHVPAWQTAQKTAERKEVKPAPNSYMIPPQSNVSEPWPVDWWLYKERHLVECFFQKLKWLKACGDCD